jgi:hypothetical protein
LTACGHVEQAMTNIDTDYLVIGAGAVGLAFADTIIAETDADVVIVDRHGKPGGHWNDAYSFVALHQPSAFYGVNSLPLGTGRKDKHGVNAGLYELASGPEVNGYFDAVMRQQLLASGRVRYFPMSDYLWSARPGEHRFRSLLSGAETEVAVRRRLVDATYFGTSVPATHKPRYAIADDARVVPPNALSTLWMEQDPPTRFCIIGAGKTAMDVGVWLLGSGADPMHIHWVMPRDSWLLNRLRTQPGVEFFDAKFGGQAAQMEAFASAESVDDIFARLEAAGVVMRIDQSRQPGMFHYATISEGEVAELRRISNVIRMGRVQSVEADRLVLDDDEMPMDPGTLYIDCTASAVEPRPTVPMFQAHVITPQLVRVPQPAFSAALVAYVEAHYEDDDSKNRLCAPVPFPHQLSDYPRTNVVNMMNQFQWMQDKDLSRWIRNSRLDGFGKLIAAVGPGDADRIAVLEKMRGHAMGAMANLQRLAAAAV